MKPGRVYLDSSQAFSDSLVSYTLLFWNVNPTYALLSSYLTFAFPVNAKPSITKLEAPEVIVQTPLITASAARRRHAGLLLQ